MMGRGGVGTQREQDVKSWEGGREREKEGESGVGEVGTERKQEGEKLGVGVGMGELGDL